MQLNLSGFDQYCQNINFISSKESYKTYLRQGIAILDNIADTTIEDFAKQIEQSPTYLKAKFKNENLYNNFKSAVKKYISYLQKEYPRTKNEITNEYDNIYNKVKNNGSIRLETFSNNPFIIEVNSSSLCVRGDGGDGQECMSVSKDKILRILYEDEKFTYSSYEPRIINLLFGLIDVISTSNSVTKENIKDEMGNKIMSKSQQASLNQILYGPPGTGKTYYTIDKALLIIDGEVPNDRREAKERFETLKKEGQIEFVTFHQSYGYEEFVEGIKADVESDDIRYSIEDGIFQKLSRIAEKNYNKSVSMHESKKDFEVVFKERILDRLNEDKLKIDTPKKYFYITDVTDRTVFFEKASGNTAHTLSLKSLRKMYELGKNDFLLGGLSVYYQPILELLLKDAVEDKEPEILKNYILIIDEINRGNISKIFGELITLIEESKRLGNDEAMEVTLPYSGEKFGVPKNLYIIGTMNTADRSIALMDTALRRRFEFEEMMPNSCLLYNDKNTYDLEGNDEKEDITKLCNWHMTSKNNDLYFHKNHEHDILINNINLRRLLYKINQRIEYLYDRDHTIGHAYFMGVADKESLDSVMRNKVIPLLQEYFYDDWEKIRLVLNDGFITRHTQDASKLFDTIDDEYIEDDKNVYSIASHFTLESYVKIYAKIEQIQVGE